MPNHPNRTKTNRPAAGNPTPAEVKRAREDEGLTLEQAAALVYATWHTWWKWEQPARDANHRRMHPSTWELFRVKVAARRLLERGELTAGQLRALDLHLPEK